MHVNDLLKIAVDAGASDLHLKVGSYPMMRVRGSLVPATEDKRLDHEDVVAMQRAAAHIHDVIHRGGSRAHLRRDVRELDRLQHHVEDLVDRMIARRELSPAGASHIRQSLARAGRTIHRMMDEVR